MFAFWECVLSRLSPWFVLCSSFLLYFVVKWLHVVLFVCVFVVLISCFVFALTCLCVLVNMTLLIDVLVLLCCV